ncbi:MAG: serine/threonine protein kinase, partial [Solirubrobacterales bacterium]|nr:serine/threonine protein kinase [Solirubrobacterales bacterium]
LAADRTQRGTGSTPGASRPAGPVGVSLGRSSAHDYDPFGSDGEHHEQAAAAVDRTVSSSWSTEGYQGGVLNKPGVGLYVDAKPGVAAVRIDIRTPTPGWKGEVYVAKDAVPKDFPGDWISLGKIDDAQRKTSLDLDTASNRYRYYLVWITQLPPGQERAQISEIDLFQRKS